MVGGDGGEREHWRRNVWEGGERMLENGERMLENGERMLAKGERMFAWASLVLAARFSVWHPLSANLRLTTHWSNAGQMLVIFAGIGQTLLVVRL